MTKLLLTIWLLLFVGIAPFAQACGINCLDNEQKVGFRADHSCCGQKTECIQTVLTKATFQKVEQQLAAVKVFKSLQFAHFETQLLPLHDHVFSFFKGPAPIPLSSPLYLLKGVLLL